jgi:hypothetical protein
MALGQLRRWRSAGGDAVLCTFLRIDDAADPGTPQAYRHRRGQDAGLVAAQIRAGGRPSPWKLTCQIPPVQSGSLTRLRLSWVWWTSW